MHNDISAFHNVRLIVYNIRNSRVRTCGIPDKFVYRGDKTAPGDSATATELPSVRLSEVPAFISEKDKKTDADALRRSIGVDVVELRRRAPI